MSFRPHPDDLRDEHPIAIFIIVAGVFLTLLAIAAHFSYAADDRESRQLFEATNPAGGGVNLATTESAFARYGGDSLPSLLQAVTAEVAAEAAVTPPVAPPADADAVPSELTQPVAATPPAEPLSAPPAVTAGSYAILERSCGALVYGANEHARVAPASVTKIFTAMVTERVEPNLDQMVDIHVSGSAMARTGSSVMGVEPGMRLSIRDLLYGLQLPSGNDAALALAEHVGGGSVNRFVDIMNEEANRLGLHDTHFVNPHGLDSNAHYSSAYDLAVAGRAYLDYPTLAEISATPYYQPNWSNGALKNGNKLLEQYPGSFGVKIGYTTKAKQTIVAAAERDGRQLVLTVLGSDNRYTDSIALFNWAFSQTQPAC